MTRRIGVDVSHYQGSNPWTRLDRGGVDFAVAKASQGTGSVDPLYRENAERLTKVRALTPDDPFDIGAYHYLEGHDGAAQAKHFRAVIGDPTAQRLIAIVDVETAVGPNPHFRDVRAFVSAWRDITHGHPLLIYTSEGYWLAIGNPDGASLGCELFLARYTVYHQDLDGSVDTSNVRFRAGFGGWVRPRIVQFGPLVFHGSRYDGDVTDGPLDDLLAPPTKPWVPIPERPQYALGYNATVTRLTQVIGQLLTRPDIHPAHVAGQQQALADAADAIARLAITSTEAP